VSAAAETARLVEALGVPREERDLAAMLEEPTRRASEIGAGRPSTDRRRRMTLENAKRFIEVASQDQALRKRLAAREPAEALRLAVEAGSERGLPFTPEEFAAGIRTMQDNITNENAGELSDSELDQVSGGLLFAGFVAFAAGFIGAAGGKKYADEINKLTEAAVAPSSLVKDYLKN
jgi:predicted ribosomally synthesized peptide with nif11-like leader